MRLLSFFLIFLNVASAFGQRQSKADSLRPIYLSDTVKGEARMELLRELAFNEINDPDQALQYAEELIRLARELGHNRYLYRGYLQKGNSQISQGNLAVALEAYEAAKDAAIADDYKNGEGTALTMLGEAYSYSGEPDRAAKYYETSIKVHRDSAALAEPNGLFSLGITLFNVGDFYLDQGELYRAEELLEEAGEIFEDIGYQPGLNYVHGTQGILYAKIGEIDRAEVQMTEAILRLEEDMDYPAITEYQTSLSDIYRERGEYGRAHSWASLSLEHALRLGLKDQISKSSGILAELDSLTGNFSEAYGHLKMHMQYKDSMDVETMDLSRHVRDIAELEAANAKTELELESQKRMRERAALWATGVTALLFIIVAMGVFGRYRYMRKTNRIISEERDRSEDLLLNILPKETAHELKEKGRVKAQRFDAVTVLFTDFQGFTKHAESLDPEKLVKSLDHYFGYFDTLMDKYGLEKIKTVGDAYMCASGLPFPSKDHALRVVEAAIEMLEFVEASKSDPAEEHIRFDVRIGINSGPVVAGIVGTKKFAYDIWGDTVNIASRMESTSEVGRINVAEETYQLIKDDYECEYRGKIDAKNRGKLNMYFLVGRKTQSKTA